LLFGKKFGTYPDPFDVSPISIRIIEGKMADGLLGYYDPNVAGSSSF